MYSVSEESGLFAMLVLSGGVGYIERKWVLPDRDYP